MSCLPNALGTPTTHLVTGTVGGFVYAIEPGSFDPTDPMFIPSTLSYASEDLG